MTTLEIKSWFGHILATTEKYDSLTEWARSTDLLMANLSGANLSDANLSGANLSRANLIRANLRDANLREADLSGANLSRANLRDANLREADLSGANLSEADLIRANLIRANLIRANLSDADLSGATGLINPAEWLKTNFETDAEGVIVYKRVGKTEFSAPDAWAIEPGAYLTEVVNPTRTIDCACGVNFGTRDWCAKNYPNAALWRCRIEWMDLAGVVVPYHTDGKARCERLRLIEMVSE